MQYVRTFSKIDREENEENEKNILAGSELMLN